MYYRLAAGLPAFVSRAVGMTDAGFAVDARMQQREESFLNVVALAEMSKTRPGCCLTTFASSAVRVCVAARNEGLDLQRVSFITIGEPLTDAKRREILSVGARPIPRYAITEAGIVAYGCGAATAPDDMHLLRDNLAAIQCPRQVRGANIQVPAFYLTSLLPTSPKMLLNVESGDYGVMEHRECQCLFGQLGYTAHLSSVRSYEKFTSEGVTFVGTDLLRIVEEVLPRRFGGDVTDYQVVEDDGPEGLPQLFLQVSPRVGEIDESDVIRTFLQELGGPAEAQKIMSDMWQQASTLKVRRALPGATRAGKVFPFHLAVRNP